MEGETIDMERSYKLPREHRYFNVSVLWIFYYTKIVKLLYRLRIRHELVTLTSLGCGVVGGLFLLRPGYGNLLLAALFLHMKDVFDASDGSLARLQKKTNRIARFLDSLSDMAAMTWLLAALAVRSYPLLGPGVILLAVAGWFSLFIQCSYFNYYLVSYTALFGKTNVRTDERLREEDKEMYRDAARRTLLVLLQRIYGLAYGWQDRLVASLDRRSMTRTLGEGPKEAGGELGRLWYGDKRLMTLNSPLCFGTHIFIFMVTAVLSRPEYFFYIVVFALNLFLAANILYRERRLGMVFSRMREVRGT